MNWRCSSRLTMESPFPLPALLTFRRCGTLLQNTAMQQCGSGPVNLIVPSQKCT